MLTVLLTDTESERQAVKVGVIVKVEQGLWLRELVAQPEPEGLWLPVAEAD